MNPYPRIACALSLLALSSAEAQLSVRPYRQEADIESRQFQLPWDGPAAAAFNPSLIAETRRFDISTSMFSAVSGKGATRVQTGAVRVYHGLYAGAGWFENGSTIDGSTALYTESILTPMLAYGWHGIAGSGYSLDFGAAYEVLDMNAFGAVSSTVTALDLGLHLLWPSLPNKLGRFHSGLALYNLDNSGVRLPDDNGGKYYPGWYGETSVLWSGLGDCVDLFSSMAFYGSWDRSEGPEPDRYYWKSAGVEVRPIPMVGLKLEHTWLGYWTAGTVLRFVVKEVHFGGELDLSHDKLSAQDEGRGYVWAFALNAGM
ncbi:MAG: hypothetical protein JWO30_2268 [Fibrobacteres bacterium]|nr:hypothetical protein [Fibrobacterota bacterium]